MPVQAVGLAISHSGEAKLTAPGRFSVESVGGRAGINGRAPVTPDMAVRLAGVFGTAVVAGTEMDSARYRHIVRQGDHIFSRHRTILSGERK